MNFDYIEDYFDVRKDPFWNEGDEENDDDVYEDDEDWGD